MQVEQAEHSKQKVRVVPNKTVLFHISENGDAIFLYVILWCIPRALISVVMLLYSYGYFCAMIAWGLDYILHAGQCA